jgi:hypothetical protein
MGFVPCGSGTTIRHNTKNIHITHHAPRKQHTKATQKIKDTSHTMNTTHKKGKAISITGRGGLWACEMSRIPHVQTIGSQMAVRLSGCLHRRKISHA